MVLVDVSSESLKEDNEEIVWLNFFVNVNSVFLLVELNYWFFEFEVIIFLDLIVIIVMDNFKKGFRGLILDFKDIVK